MGATTLVRALPHGVLAGVLVGVLSVLESSALEAADTQKQTIDTPISRGGFTLLREPSGVILLDDTTLMVIEDEPARALRRLTLTKDKSGSIRFEEFEQAAAKGFLQRRLLGPLDDLEGIARLSPTQFVVIGSHEQASRREHPLREKLVLFTREQNTLTSASVRRDLFEQITLQYPSLAKRTKKSRKHSERAFNIEGLAFDRKRKHLLIGLRSPTLHDNAVIIRLLNTMDYLQGDAAVFATELQQLDLNKDGIRALAYDDQSDSLLIVSKQERSGNARSTLWILNAASDNSATRLNRLRSNDKKLFDDVEGLTPFADGVLFVRDSGGDRKHMDDAWFVLERSQLGLE